MQKTKIVNVHNWDYPSKDDEFQRSTLSRMSLSRIMEMIQFVSIEKPDEYIQIAPTLRERRALFRSVFGVPFRSRSLEIVASQAKIVHSYVRTF